MIPNGKKIAILHPEVSTKGGAVSMMLYLSRMLSEKGNKVVVFTTRYDEDFSYKDISFVVGSKLYLVSQIRDFDYLFIGNSPMQFVGVASKIIYFSRAKIFWWHHHYPWYYNGHTNFYVFLKRFLEKLSLLFIDEIIVNSVYLQEIIKQVYKKDSKILSPVVDNIFLDTNKNKNTNKPILFTYGRWVEGKNLKQIFQTYEYIQPKVPKLELYIAGVGDRLGYFEEQYKDDPQVHFLGLLDKKQLVQYLQKTRVFLFPSMIDSFGMSAMEAICAGVPVVGFIGRGLSEIVQNNKNGCTVGSSKEFTQKTFCLLTDNNFYAQISQQIHTTTDTFSSVYFEKNLERIFE